MDKEAADGSGKRFPLPHFLLHFHFDASHWIVVQLYEEKVLGSHEAHDMVRISKI